MTASANIGRPARTSNRRLTGSRTFPLHNEALTVVLLLRDSATSSTHCSAVAVRSKGGFRSAGVSRGTYARRGPQCTHRDYFRRRVPRYHASDLTGRAEVDGAGRLVRKRRTLNVTYPERDQGRSAYSARGSGRDPGLAAAQRPAICI